MWHTVLLLVVLCYNADKQAEFDEAVDSCRRAVQSGSGL